MSRQIAIAAVFLMCSSFMIGQDSLPERTVQKNVIASKRDPAIRITLPEDVKYVGAERWVLYGVADCELHAFLEADAHQEVQRMYWVQFESYLPSRPDLHHTYDSPKHATIGGLDFYVDSWARAKDAKTQSGSDREHIQRMISTKGYRMPEGTMDVRLVHLLDPAKRKELMIIFSENLKPTGFTAAELSEGGKDFDRWPDLANKLLDDAQKRISISAEN